MQVYIYIYFVNFLKKRESFLNLEQTPIRDQRSEIRDQRSEIRDQRSEIRDQRSEKDGLSPVGVYRWAAIFLHLS